ncbi:MAG: hypothetical protein K2F89_04475, partial [Treponemataceae bacterium]|nr:hypothetical protein [Treponemataceae bacterium]
MYLNRSLCMSMSKSATNSPRAAAYSSPSKSSPSARRVASANSSHASYNDGAAQNTHNGMRKKIATAANVFFMRRQYSTFSGNVG